MYVRLAFAVAAHLEPEILVVDEVLSVGDAAFQKKCLGKIGTVAKEGRTVVLVSHNMPSIQAMCHQVFLLQKGKLKVSGDPHGVISTYLSDGISEDSAEIDLSNHPGRSHSREPALRKAWILNSEGMKSNSVMMGKSFTVCFEFNCARPIKTPGFGFVVEDEHGKRIFVLNNYMVPAEANTFLSLNAGVASLCIDKLPLLPGPYFLTLSLVEDQREWVDCVERALAIHVEPADVFGSGKIPDHTQGIVYVPGQIRVFTGHNMGDIYRTPSIMYCIDAWRK
jgi:lipopolysaccharide transport system ATP-binding protein